MSQPVPQWEGDTYRDLVGYALTLQAAAEAAERDRQRIQTILEGGQ